MNFERKLATTSRSLSESYDAAVHRPNGGCDERAGGSAPVIGSSIGTHWFYVVPVVVLFLAYTATLYVARDEHLDQAILGGLANTVPVVLLGSAAGRAEKLVPRPLLWGGVRTVLFLTLFPSFRRPRAKRSNK